MNLHAHIYVSADAFYDNPQAYAYLCVTRSIQMNADFLRR